MTSTNAERRALVTGVTGFAGLHLARLLLEDGWQVAGLARGGAAPEGVDLHRGDIADVGEVIEQVRPSAVFHLAAIVDTVTTPSLEELERVNVGGTQAVVDALAGSDMRLVLASSAFVYGSTTPEEQPLSESQPLRPLTPYGETKVAAEQVALAYPGAVVARSFQHTGPGHVGAYALPDWAEQLARGATTISTGNLDVERDYLDVRDVARAYAKLADCTAPERIYNVGSGTPVTMRALLEGLIEAFGTEAEIVTDPSRVLAVDLPKVVADHSLLTAATGWTPAIDLRTTLADLAAFWRGRVA